MKVIDEKGRLFNKINIIDFLVILFLVSLAPMFYFGYKLYMKPTAVVLEPKESIVVLEPKESIEIEIECKFIKVKPEILKLIAVGDKDIDKNGKQIGEITWISEIWPFKYLFDMGETEQRYEVEDPTLKQLFAKLKLIVEVRGNEIYYNDKRILINSQFNFETNKYTVKAIPIVEKE